MLYQDSDRDEQLWKIVGVDKDVNGDYINYKVLNKANTSMALILNLSTNKTMLGTYAGNTTHKWKLVSDGLVGFAGFAKDLNGVNKTGTIGGVLGKTVYVDTLSELKSALLDTSPLTIVITSNIDDCNSETYDLRIASNKTIIGSYALSTPSGTVTTFNPSSKYSYPIVKAYDASGYDVKGFCTSYTGAVSSYSVFKYIHHSDVTSYLE